MAENILFEEKQYLGLNKQSIIGRTILVLFCFIAYYWSENPKPVDVSVIHIGSYPAEDIPNSGQLFFIMGLVILLLSASLIFVLHIHTLVSETSVTLNGLWSSRKVKIDLNSIVSVKKTPYSKYPTRRPVYNLHAKGKIRFYTQGNEAVELTDKDGLKYRIGSQRTDEFFNIIQNQLNKKTNA